MSLEDEQQLLSLDFPSFLNQTTNGQGTQQQQHPGYYTTAEQRAASMMTGASTNEGPRTAQGIQSSFMEELNRTQMIRSNPGNQDNPSMILQPEQQQQGQQQPEEMIDTSEPSQ
jgi:hypothetical protein